MKIFPYVLLRIAGLEFNKLESLNAEKSSLILEDIAGLKHNINLLKTEICDNIYAIIHSNTDSSIQNQLLNFKRNIFNERKIDGKNLNTICQYLPGKIVSKIKSLLDLEEKVNTLIESGEVVFNDELNNLRNNFRELAKNEQLQKGLVISSQSLFERTLSYIKKNNAHLNKDDYRTEQSLIKYISRMGAKTSPFSTFTNLAMCKTDNINGISNSANNGVLYLSQNEAKKPQAVSHIRINNFLFQYLKGLLIKNRDIYQWFLIRPNPTIKKLDTEYVYLTNCNNVESFQRIPANPALEVFIILAKNKVEGIVIHDLVNEIVSNQYIDAPSEDIEMFIVQLIEYGFLEFNFEVSGIDPDWDIKLSEKLNLLSEKSLLIDELNTVLKQIREYARRYGQESIDNRKNLLKDAYGSFKDICLKLHEAAGLPEEERMDSKERIKMMEEKKKEKDESTQEEKKEEDKPEEEVFKHRTNTAFNYKPEQVFLEDTSIDIQLGLDLNQLCDFTLTLDNLMQTLKPLAVYKEEKDKMYYYFANKYGLDAEIDVLNFYEDYFREFKKPEAERQEKARRKEKEKNEEGSKSKADIPVDGKSDLNGKDTEQIQEENPPQIPAITERQEKSKLWQEAFVSEINELVSKNNGQININADNFCAANKKINLETVTEKKDVSYGIFVQLYTDKNEDGSNRLMGVINNSLPGFGKFVSRFLHLFPEDMTDELRTWNSRLNPGSILAEDCDESHFNANLHPALMPYEVWLPTSQNSLPADKQIPVTDLKIKADRNNSELKLFHFPSDKEVYVFDLGFQSIMGRSHLFQILDKFSLSESLYWQNVLFSINGDMNKSIHDEKQPSKINVRPRITYENRIVLQRKAWFVPKDILPLKKPKESDWQYFARINDWRLKNGIPDEVFVFIINRMETGNLNPESFKKLSRDDYKPQYISFKNPFLFELFSKLLNKVPSVLKIEEMLPDSSHLLKIGDEKYVGEFVIQWYKYNNEHDRQ